MSDTQQASCGSCSNGYGLWVLLGILAAIIILIVLLCVFLPQETDCTGKSSCHTRSHKCDTDPDDSGRGCKDCKTATDDSAYDRHHRRHRHRDRHDRRDRHRDVPADSGIKIISSKNATITVKYDEDDSALEKHSGKSENSSNLHLSQEKSAKSENAAKSKSKSAKSKSESNEHVFEQQSQNSQGEFPALVEEEKKIEAQPVDINTTGRDPNQVSSDLD